MTLSICAGSANPYVRESVAAALGTALGERVIKRVADGEIHFQIQETVRCVGRRISTCQSGMLAC